MGLVRGQGLEIITPIRGRKLLEARNASIAQASLEIITPIRGRKHYIEPIITDDNRISLEIITPIRGRKRFFCRVNPTFWSMFRNNNPDKGTETDTGLDSIALMVLQFRNNNPDKGTETSPSLHRLHPKTLRLEIITPIRGRKL